MDFTEYIKPELLILIPVLYVIGMAVKKTALIADKLIPLDRKSTRLNSSHNLRSRMPSSA